jgi:hypothetical protein
MYGAAKTDLDRRVWFPRIHDYGLSRLHIHELVFDLPGRVQAKFLRFFRMLNGTRSLLARRQRLVERVVLNALGEHCGASRRILRLR